MYKRIVPILVSGILTIACQSASDQQKDQNVEAGQNGLTVETQSKLDSLTALVDMHPEDAGLFMERAKEFLVEKNYARAEADLQRAVELEPANSQYLLAFGNHLLLTNKSRKARDIWTLCTEADAENTACRLKLAELYLLVQQYEDVFKYAREVLMIDNSKHMAYFYMGMASVEMGDTTKAIHNLQSSIEKNPDFIRGMDQLAYLYGLKGDYLAIDYYNNILNVDPNRSNTYFNIGTFYQRKKRYDLAISNYLTGLQLDPENAGMFYNLGFVYTELKEFDKAIHAFSNAIRIKPAYHEAYFARGYIYTQLDNTIKALEDYKSCVILKPGYVPALNEIERIEGK